MRFGDLKLNIELMPDEFVESSGLYRNYDHAWKKRSDFFLAPGVGRSIEIKRLNLYAGLDIPYSVYGKTQAYYFTQSDNATTGAPISSTEQSGTIFKACSIGIGNFAGFVFKFKGFSIGGELSYAFLYNKRLSKSTFHVVNTDLQD